MSSIIPDRLRVVPLFSSLEKDALADAAQYFSEFKAGAGQLLIARGQPGMGLYIVEKGTVRIEFDSRAPVELGPGEFFGEVALLTSVARTAQVVTVVDTTCLAIGRSEMIALLETYPTVTLAMLRTVARRLAWIL